MEGRTHKPHDAVRTDLNVGSQKQMTVTSCVCEFLIYKKERFVPRITGECIPKAQNAHRINKVLLRQNKTHWIQGAEAA